MRVVLALNAHIRREDRHGPGSVGYGLARGLNDRGMLGKLVCYSVDELPDIPRHLIETADPLLWRKIHRLGQLAGQVLPQLPLRRLQEQRFDAIVQQKLNRDWGDTLLCTKPVNPDTISKARQLGMRTAMLTSVLHPRFNQKRVLKEKQRQQMTGYSVYTDEQRTARLARAVSTVDTIIAANGYFRENYARYGVARDKFMLLEPERPHEGVRTDHFCPPPSGVLRSGRFSVLHVAHMTLIKGVQYLLAAWEKIEDRIDGDLVLFGPMDRDIRRVVRSSGCRKLRLIGFGDPLPEYRCASVFVSPSISDAGPNTVLEAMACGTPPIVSTSCGSSYFIRNGVNGFTYQYDDPDRLASLIITCHEDRERREAMGREAAATAARFPITDYTDLCLSLLRTGASAADRSRPAP